jgi:hypothetical protein
VELIHRAQPGLLLFLAAFFFYCLLSPGNLPGDTEIRWSVSRQFVRTQEFSIEDYVATRYYATGVDGQRYSFWGPGQQVILLPFAYAGLLLEKVGMSGAQADLAAQFCAAVVLFPFLGALTVRLFFHVVLLLGYATRIALVSALVFGFATMHVHYTVFTHEQSQVALLLLLQLWCMLKVLQTQRSVYAWGLCAAMGLCLFFRLSSAFETFSVFAVALCASVAAAPVGARYAAVKIWIRPFIFGCGPFVAALAWYNAIRFGSVFETGYGIAAVTMFGGIGAFETNPLDSVPGMLFSPGKSIFFYNPVLVLLFFSLYSFFRRHLPVAIAIVSAVVVNILFNSLHTTWAGDYAWSCRYQASVVPLLIIPLVCFFDRARGVLVRIFVWALMGASLLIQLASVTYSFHLEFVQNPNHGLIPGGYIWKWEESHLIKRFENIALHALGKREFKTTAVYDEAPHLMQTNRSADQVKAAYMFNFSPFKAHAMQVADSIVYALAVFWAVLAVFFLICATGLYGFLTCRESQHVSSGL